MHMLIPALPTSPPRPLPIFSTPPLPIHQLLADLDNATLRLPDVDLEPLAGTLHTFIRTLAIHFPSWHRSCARNLEHLQEARLRLFHALSRDHFLGLGGSVWAVVVPWLRRFLRWGILDEKGVEWLHGLLDELVGGVNRYISHTFGRNYFPPQLPASRCVFDTLDCLAVFDDDSDVGDDLDTEDAYSTEELEKLLPLRPEAGGPRRWCWDDFYGALDDERLDGWDMVYALDRENREYAEKLKCELLGPPSPTTDEEAGDENADK